MRYANDVSTRMADGRSIDVQFCDDVRVEVGNKLSLMGVYGPTMIVKSVPAILSKLCINVRVYSPATQPLGKLDVKVLRDEKPILESTFTQPSPTHQGVSQGWLLANFVLSVVPFAVDKRCALRVVVDTGEEILEGVPLRIELAAS